MGCDDLSTPTKQLDIEGTLDTMKYLCPLFNLRSISTRKTTAEIAVRRISACDERLTCSKQVDVAVLASTQPTAERNFLGVTNQA
jgi:hypothetical protein